MTKVISIFLQTFVFIVLYSTITSAYSPTIENFDNLPSISSGEAQSLIYQSYSKKLSIEQKKLLLQKILSKVSPETISEKGFNDVDIYDSLFNNGKIPLIPLSENIAKLVDILCQKNLKACAEKQFVTAMPEGTSILAFVPSQKTNIDWNNLSVLKTSNGYEGYFIAHLGQENPTTTPYISYNKPMDWIIKRIDFRNGAIVDELKILDSRSGEANENPGLQENNGPAGSRQLSGIAVGFAGKNKYGLLMLDGNANNLEGVDGKMNESAYRPLLLIDFNSGKMKVIDSMHALEKSKIKKFKVNGQDLMVEYSVRSNLNPKLPNFARLSLVDGNKSAVVAELFSPPSASQYDMGNWNNVLQSQKEKTNDAELTVEHFVDLSFKVKQKLPSGYYLVKGNNYLKLPIIDEKNYPVQPMTDENGNMFLVYPVATSNLFERGITFVKFDILKLNEKLN
jgi:hypothetical protein